MSLISIFSKLLNEGGGGGVSVKKSENPFYSLSLFSKIWPRDLWMAHYLINNIAKLLSQFKRFFLNKLTNQESFFLISNLRAFINHAVNFWVLLNPLPPSLTSLLHQLMYFGWHLSNSSLPLACQRSLWMLPLVGNVFQKGLKKIFSHLAKIKCLIYNYPTRSIFALIFSILNAFMW